MKGVPAEQHACCEADNGRPALSIKSSTPLRPTYPGLNHDQRLLVSELKRLQNTSTSGSRLEVL